MSDVILQEKSMEKGFPELQYSRTPPLTYLFTDV